MNVLQCSAMAKSKSSSESHGESMKNEEHGQNSQEGWVEITAKQSLLFQQKVVLLRS